MSKTDFSSTSMPLSNQDSMSSTVYYTATINLDENFHNKKYYKREIVHYTKKLLKTSWWQIFERNFLINRLKFLNLTFKLFLNKEIKINKLKTNDKKN